MAGADFPLENARCDRARQWSSLRLDGELSELESVLLDKHLEACGACFAFDRRLQTAATALRLTPPEPPLAPIQPELPERPVAFPVRRRLVVAAIAAALALGSVVGSSLHRTAPDTSVPAPQVSLLTRDMSQLREIPRGERVSPPAPAHDPGGPPEGLI
jgi:Putative zinc-finger